MSHRRSLILSNLLVVVFAWLFCAGCLEPSSRPIDPTREFDAGRADAGPGAPDARGEDAGTVDGVDGGEELADAGVVADGGLVHPSLDGAIRIATFNVHRFFDTVCDSEAGCGSGAYEELPSQTAFESKAGRLAKAIQKLDPTVILLQEIETEACMTALAERLPELPVRVLGEMHYPATVDVAVMARGEFLEARRHRSLKLPLPDGTTTRFAREFLELHLGIDGRRVIVFVAHFISRLDPADDARRLAEAQAAASIITTRVQEYPEALIVFGGDLNDDPGTDPIDAIEGTGEVLRLASELSAGEQGTYYYRGRDRAIDHLFQLTGAAGRYLPGSVRIVRDSATGGLGGSDHAAVRADFEH